jgi:hypothetical protein
LRAQTQAKAKGQVQEKVKAQGQSHAANLCLQGKSAVSGGNFNNDWHAATLRLQGKPAPASRCPPLQKP